MKSVNLFIALAICLIANTVHAQTIYMKFTQYDNTVATAGLGKASTAKDGTNTVDLHDYIEVASAQFDEQQTLNIGSTSSGANTPNLVFNPFTITKPVDTFTANLFQYMASGKPYKFVEILFVKSGGSNVGSVFYKVLLKYVLVNTQAVSSVADCSDGCVVESVSFAYAGMLQTTYKQQSDGFTPNSTTGWNRLRNQPDTDPTTPINP